MKKKLNLICVCIALLLCITGCGGIKEKDLIGENYSFKSENGISKKGIEFKEANVAIWHDDFGNTSQCEYYFENGYLILQYGENKTKYKISDDLKTITEIGTEEVFIRK